MIVITGAAGFIGSCLAGRLNNTGREDLLLVDDFTVESKRLNWVSKKYKELIPRDDFFKWAEKNVKNIDFIYHLGARTDTTEQDYSIMQHLNLDYSRRIWSFAAMNGIPLVYASSGATYGDGKYGYNDDMETSRKIIPLNAYGKSKQEFDLWVLKQSKTPPYWAGLKFFNVFGPNEYHKGRMASVAFHGFNQIRETGSMKLFRSHRENYKDGEQLRDFIYVKDILNVLSWFGEKPRHSGIYNLGTGYARPFIALANAIFMAMDQIPSIEFIDIPEDIRNAYQYYTQADMKKLKAHGYKKPFSSLESGVKDYIRHYLMPKAYF